MSDEDHRDRLARRQRPAAPRTHRVSLAPDLPLPRGGEVTLVHGAGDGVDRIAAALATGWHWTVEPHPADWTGPCAPDCPKRAHRIHRANGISTCPGAGPRRNRHMAALGADLCVAFPGPGSRGTWDCLRWATRYGIPSQIWPLGATR